MSSLSVPEFSIRIVVCDHYMTKPLPGIDVLYSEFRGSDIKQVPVLRIFGPASDGHKACLHIHGVFPYFYVPCPTRNPEPQFLYQIAASLDKAINIALKQATSCNQHIYKISLVKGLPFYGFHDKDHLYLKIFLYNPGLIKQAVELCSNGTVLGQSFQPHESHLNFTLQFFIDFNLFGMSNIELQTLKFRRNSSTSRDSDVLPDSFIDCPLKPESVCYYEADCIASHIINRQRIGKGDGIENPGLEEVWNQEMERRKQLNISMASKSLSQGRLNATETDSHYKYNQMFHIKMSNLIDKPVEIDKNVQLANEIQYPAETVEGSILHKAVDVSVHQPDNTIMGSGERLSNYSTSEDLDSTLMNKSIALDNSAVHYSQIILDSDDMEFVDMLQDMEEEKCVENDSILGTPLDVDDQQEKESDDEEYSQIFHEETIVLDKSESKEDNEVSQSPNWNDSFWDGVNIPQLDGTCDDEHTKKVRKRKMKPLRVGLSRPVSKRNLKDEVKSEIKPEPETTNLCNDDIKIEEETELKDVSIPSDKVAPTQFCNENIKIEEESVLNVGSVIFEEDENNCNSQYENTSVTELVNMKEMQAEHTHVQTHFEPVAGPSFIKCNDIKSSLDVSLVSSSSPEDNNLGIKSFYNVSNMFNVSLDDSDEEIDTSNGSMNFKVSQGFEEESKSNDKIMYSPTGSLSFSKSVVLVPKINPPSKNDIISSLSTYKIPKIRHPQPYYSNHKDVGDKVEIGQTVLKIKSKLAQDQKAFDSILDTTTIEEWRQLLFLQNNLTNDSTYDANVLKTLLAGNKQCILEPIKKPPNAIEVKKWLESRKSIEEANVNKDDCKEITKNLDELDNSQAIGLEDSINNSISLDITDSKDKVVDESLQVTMQSDGSYLCFGNATSHNDTIDSSTIEVNFLTVMILEVHTAVRGDLCPDPTVDSIKAVFLTITNDSPPDHFLSKSITEVIVVNETSNIKRFERCVFNVPIVYVNTENEVMEKVIESIRRNNPDIMCGYEIEMNSWGYFIERALTLGLEIIQEMSRITEKHRQKRARSNESDFEGRIIGRVTFNVWRLFRYELALSSYSFENCMYEILKERVPKYSYAQLDAWWNDESRVLRWIPMEYYLTRLSGTIRMLEKLDIINRTSELARLFGLQWWEVLSRGSQFRVESLMLRAARPLNLIALSPTVKQRAAMKAPECLPLIFEPQSRFYADPMIVLDFQSLYPSMMIAYNYCFSTCIGRVQNINGNDSPLSAATGLAKRGRLVERCGKKYTLRADFTIEEQSSYEFGAWRLRISQSKLETLVKNGLVHWSPVGVGFVKAEVRRGVLPTLLRRILAARQAVKKSMKLQTDEAVKKAMHSRQLGLKLIANVTYGYTAANFSGRMPCVEVADSVVSKGRETLERAIKLVENSPQWNAKVVYGDTDSMFILVPGGTRAEAFQIGQEIADAVTADNPSPVALKLEKVYQPCILQTKKRYVGYMYESPDQEVPVYEAKGIETVRRDGCPAGVKLLQRCLCELFGSGDMSLVKRHVTEVLSRLVQGSLPVHELFFTREYNGPNGYRPGAAAPPAEIAKRLSTRDARALPRTGERVSWLVSAGAPSLPLVKLARTPAELDREPNLRPHVAYYVTRVLLPPLHRCLSLLGVNVFKWWNEIGYIREVSLQHHGGGGGIARYLWRERCALCSARSQRSICTDCTATPQRAASAVCVRWNTATSHVRLCGQICSTCCGHGHSSMCTNCECPEFWRRHTAQQKLNHVQDIIKQFPDGLICSQSFDF